MSQICLPFQLVHCRLLLLMHSLEPALSHTLVQCQSACIPSVTKKVNVTKLDIDYPHSFTHSIYLREHIAMFVFKKKKKKARMYFSYLEGHFDSLLSSFNIILKGVSAHANYRNGHAIVQSHLIASHFLLWLLKFSLFL